MAGEPRRSRRPGLDSESFEALLARLDPVRERAGEKYEAIRWRLLRFFECRGASRPDELADEAIDRVCRKLALGETIRVPDIGRYFLGVGRNVLREAWDGERRRGIADLVPERPAPSPLDEEAVFACLERCLEALPPESRDLLLRYYGAAGAEKVPARQALAARMGVGANALRIRLHRLRAKLERCIRACMGGAETSLSREPSSSEGSRG